MINLAGVEDCDLTITQELNTSGIERVYIGERIGDEVKSQYIGKCNNFIFVRAWTYWIVSGYMPLQYAKEMYAKFKNLNIRVAGHCGNPPPEEWCRSKDYAEKRTLYLHKYWQKEISKEEFNTKCKELMQQEDQFVTCYHIDMQEGLNKFIEIVKKYNIIG